MPLTNKEKIKQYKKLYYLKNCEKIKEYYLSKKEFIKEYRLKNIDNIKKYTKQYYLDNKDNFKEYNKLYRSKNKDKEKEYYLNNKDKKTEFNRLYHLKNLDEIKKKMKLYRLNKPHIHKALSAKRRATQLKATPKFADLNKIKLIYRNCPKGFHVDHIVPLQGKNVCGLHVEWNLQYLTAHDNHTKSNKLN
jgi:hypothetical protein